MTKSRLRTKRTVRTNTRTDDRRGAETALTERQRRKATDESDGLSLEEGVCEAMSRGLPATMPLTELFDE